MAGKEHNPFYVHRELLEHCCSRFDASLPDRWNIHFPDKPTYAELTRYLDELEVKTDLSLFARKKRLEQVANGDVMCYFITISFDKMILDNNTGNADIPFGAYNHDKLKKVMYQVMEAFRNAEYTWGEEPVACCEFYSKSGFNPHIHIIVKKNYKSTMKRSTIQQGLQRKFQKEYNGKKNKNNYDCYNVNVLNRPVQAGENYVSGLKQDSKLDDVALDKKYRENFNYKELYYLYE